MLVLYIAHGLETKNSREKNFIKSFLKKVSVNLQKCDILVAYYTVPKILQYKPLIWSQPSGTDRAP
jgi:hypothetical protein